MKKCFVPFPLLLISLVWGCPIFAQDQSSERELSDQSVKQAIIQYYQTIGEKSHLYNGAEYVSPVYQLTKHPFFISFYFANGSINYDGIYYPDVPMAYDILHDNVIINRYNQNFKIALANDKIDSFSLIDHHFFRLVPDSSNSLLISPGFYDRLYNGSIKVYAKRIKRMEEIIEYSVPNVIIVEDDRYFVLKNEIFYSIKNKKNLFSIYADKKKDIRKYLRTIKVKFRTNPEKAIVKATEYYDNLKK